MCIRDSLGFKVLSENPIAGRLAQEQFIANIWRENRPGPVNQKTVSESCTFIVCYFTPPPPAGVEGVPCMFGICNSPIVLEENQTTEKYTDVQTNKETDRQTKINR